MRFLMFFSITITCSISSFSQDTSLLKMLDDSLIEAPALDYVKGTFNGTTVLNLQSVEQPAKNVLEFMIMHRFGRVNEGAYNFFGLDNATLRLGLSYGITNRLTIGIGRSSLDKAFDGSVKFKLMQQREQGNPISMNLFASIVYPTQKYSDKPYLERHHRKISKQTLAFADGLGILSKTEH